jgi:hypothetical protein
MKKIILLLVLVFQTNLIVFGADTGQEETEGCQCYQSYENAEHLAAYQYDKAQNACFVSGAGASCYTQAQETYNNKLAKAVTNLNNCCGPSTCC